MRSALPILLCTLTGLAAGWIAHDLVSAPDADDAQGPSASDIAPGDTEDVGLDGSKSGIATFTVPVALRDLQARGQMEGRRAARTLQSLAMLYAVTGRTDELHKLIDMALRAGVDPGRVLDALSELPDGERAKALTAVLERHPKVEFDVADLATLLAEDGEPQRALSALRTALPKEADFRHRMTRLLIQLDPRGAPAFLFRNAESEEWSGAELRTLRGYLLAAGQEAQLTQFLLRRLEAVPGDDDALRALGGADRAAAIDHARARTASNPADTQGWRRLGHLLEQDGDARGAFEAYAHAARGGSGGKAFRALVDIDPERATSLIETLTEGSTDDELIGSAAEAFLRAGHPDRAAQLFRRALTHDPGDGEWIDGLIDTDPQGAVALIRAQMGDTPDPTDDTQLGRYGRALLGAGDSEGAFAQFERAYQADPYDDAWQLAMAETDAAKAIPLLAEHALAHPNDASGRGAHGVALARAGRHGEAVVELQHAIAEGDARQWFAELHRLDPGLAHRELEKRARRSRGHRLWGALGESLLAAGKTSEARRAFTEALRRHPSSDRWSTALRNMR